MIRNMDGTFAPATDPVSLFWSKVDKTDSCWLWTGHAMWKGYGSVKFRGVMTRAHRLAYQLTRGEIPTGHVLDHLCRNRLCVNPQHLEVVTVRENVRRGEGLAGINARKTHCHKGHEFNEANTYTDPRGSRICKPCRREGDRVRRQKELLG